MNPNRQNTQANRWQGTVAEVLPLESSASPAGKAAGRIVAHVKLTHITAEMNLKYPMVKEAAEVLLPERVLKLKAKSSSNNLTNGAWGPPRRQNTEQLPWLF
jgi:hypothetical protein